MQAQDIMTPEVITIHPEATVREVARLLSDYSISGVPVVDATGHMVGIVTQADIIGKDGTTVAEIMTERVISVTEETPVDSVAVILTSNRFKRVPVVRGDHIVGIVSRANIVRMIASRWLCPTCGGIQQDGIPVTCYACGGTGPFEREVAPRMEVSSRA